LFTGRSVGLTGYLDVSAMFAIIVYLFVAWGFKALIEYIEQKIEINKAQQRDVLRKQEREETIRRIEKAANTSKTAKK
jgi:heme exporter protein D